jgi:hypothetical protein
MLIASKINFWLLLFWIEFYHGALGAFVNTVRIQINPVNFISGVVWRIFSASFLCDRAWFSFWVFLWRVVFDLSARRLPRATYARYLDMRMHSGQLRSSVQGRSCLAVGWESGLRLSGSLERENFVPMLLSKPLVQLASHPLFGMPSEPVYNTILKTMGTLA